MGFIMDLASGEMLTDEPGYSCGRERKTPGVDSDRTLHAPQAGLALAEHTTTDRHTSRVASLDIAALVDSIKD